MFEDGVVIWWCCCCLVCDKCFMMYEWVELFLLFVVKKDGSCIEFDCCKIVVSM